MIDDVVKATGFGGMFEVVGAVVIGLLDAGGGGEAIFMCVEECCFAGGALVDDDEGLESTSEVLLRTFCC